MKPRYCNKVNNNCAYLQDIQLVSLHQQGKYLVWYSSTPIQTLFTVNAHNSILCDTKLVHLQRTKKKKKNYWTSAQPTLTVGRHTKKVATVQNSLILFPVPVLEL